MTVCRYRLTGSGTLGPVARLLGSAEDIFLQYEFALDKELWSCSDVLQNVVSAPCKSCKRAKERDVGDKWFEKIKSELCRLIHNDETLILIFALGNAILLLEAEP